MRNAIVLAAGKGTRMHSDLPKVVHKVGNMPMVEVIVRNLKKCGAERIVTVVGYGHEIVEFKDCTKEEAAVHEINTGIYAFNNQKLFEALKELKNDNAQHEYYITDLVEIFRKKGWRVTAVLANDKDEVQGVNDCSELARANKWLNTYINQKWMKAGVQFADPDTTYVGPFVTMGHDVELYPNVYLYGDTSIGDNVTIMPGAFLNNVNVHNGMVVRCGVYENTELK